VNESQLRGEGKVDLTKKGMMSNLPRTRRVRAIQRGKLCYILSPLAERGEKKKTYLPAHDIAEGGKRLSLPLKGKGKSWNVIHPKSLGQRGEKRNAVYPLCQKGGKKKNLHGIGRKPIEGGGEKTNSEGKKKKGTLLLGEKKRFNEGWVGGGGKERIHEFRYMAERRKEGRKPPRVQEWDKKRMADRNVFHKKERRKLLTEQAKTV